MPSLQNKSLRRSDTCTICLRFEISFSRPGSSQNWLSQKPGHVSRANSPDRAPRHPDFDHGTGSNWLRSVMGALNSFTRRNFHERNSRQTEKLDTECPSIPIGDMARSEQTFSSIPLYLTKNVTLTKNMAIHANQLAYLLVNLAEHIFQIPLKSLHLFRDVDSGEYPSIRLCFVSMPCRCRR